MLCAEEVEFIKANAPYLTRVQIAKALGCSQSKVRRFMEAHKITAAHALCMPQQIRELEYIPADLQVEVGKLYIKYVMPSLGLTYCYLRHKANFALDDPKRD